MTKSGEHCEVAVIGCGAAGMAAAIRAAEHGARVTVFEKNEKAGKKLFISGKGRCNLTNACDTADFFDHVIHGKKFLYSAVYGFDAERVRLFFTERGCPLKTERGGRVFPVSDKSSDIIRTLTAEMERLGVNVRYGCSVKELLLTKERYAEAEASGKDGTPGNRVTGLRLSDGSSVACKSVIIATGGLSYPATGATGDGYVFAKTAGHAVTDCRPSLVPFETAEQWHRELQGLALKNVRLYSLRAGQKNRSLVASFDEQGELLFTHFGISGPLVLTASAKLGDALQGQAAMRAAKDRHSALPLKMAIDLKPALTQEELDQRLLRDFSAQPRRQFKNSLGELFPAKLLPVMARLAEAGMPPDSAGAEHAKEAEGDTKDSIRILPDTPAGELTRKQRLAFGALMKALPVTVTGTRGFSEAVITSGGVHLREINPSTMESKLCRGLFFAGEVLDCDALTGGFNLQIAWSTGVLAGVSAADICGET